MDVVVEEVKLTSRTSKQGKQNMIICINAIRHTYVDDADAMYASY